MHTSSTARRTRHVLIAPLAAALAAITLSACVPVLVGSAVVGGTVVATDRRTAGMQLEDETIGVRASSRLSERYGDRAKVSVTSYNGSVLLTGTVPDAAAKEEAARIVSGVENVRNVINDLDIGPPGSFSTTANDTWITSQVRAALIGTTGLSSNAFTINTNHGVVYLMGRVTQREGDTAARVASGLKGVAKVVKVYDYITEEEMNAIAARPLQPQQTPQTSSAQPAQAVQPIQQSQPVPPAPAAQAMPVR